MMSSGQILSYCRDDFRGVTVRDRSGVAQLFPPCRRRSRPLKNRSSFVIYYLIVVKTIPSQS